MNFAQVTMGVSPAFNCGVPFTQDDTASATQGGAAIIIDVLFNDTPCGPYSNPNPVILAPGPNIGTAGVNNDGTISFPPPATTGTATFKYTVSNAVGTSNVATVTVDVVVDPNTGPKPTAIPDAVTVTGGTSSVIDVLANDTGNGGFLDPTTVAITTPPPAGSSAIANANGTITYTAPAAPGTFTFGYTVANTNGQVSLPATVTVTVINAQVVAITAASSNPLGFTFSAPMIA